MNKNKKVSIIIRTKNEERWIGHCIKRIHLQKYQNFEIILVDSLSSDNTVNKAKEYKIDKLVEIKNYKPGLAINEGIRASSGELIVILSAHCLPKNEFWLDDLTSAINLDESLAGVYGKQVPMDFSSDNDKRDLLIVFGEDERIQIKDSFFHNANSIIRRKVWDQINFNEKISNIEDRIWAQDVIKNGFKIKYIPKAAVYHYHGIHQSGNLKRLEGVTNVIENFKNAEAKPNLIQPDEFEVCAVIPIRGEPLIFGNKCQLQLAAYALGLEHTIGVIPELCMTFVATKEISQVFVIQKGTIEKYKNKWRETVKKYYEVILPEQKEREIEMLGIDGDIM